MVYSMSEQLYQVIGVETQTLRFIFEAFKMTWLVP